MMADAEIKPLFDTMAVIGVGLIGGSLGMAARRYRLANRVIGYGRTRANLEDAIRLEAIDGIAESMKECVKDADIVFICTPVRTISQALCEIAGSVKENAIVTDVGSTKRSVVDQAEAVIPKGRHFIGGHPMAGTEKSGAINAFAELFEGSTYVLTPGTRTDPAALEKLSSFVRGIGASLEIMSPLEHDRSAAAISHLPHIIASCLLEVGDQSNKQTGKSFKLAAGSYKDLTRIADSPADIWRDICITNADFICSEIQELIQWLNRFESALRERDEVRLLELFESGRQIRDAFNRTKE